MKVYILELSLDGEWFIYGAYSTRGLAEHHGAMQMEANEKIVDAAIREMTVFTE